MLYSMIKMLRKEDEKMFRYYLIGLEWMWEEPFFRHVSISLIGVVTLLCLRRLFAAWQSGGSFFAQRVIPLKEIRMITTNTLRGRKGGGTRYFLQIEKKHGRATAIFFGKSKKTELMVDNLQKETKKYGVKIHKGLWD